MSYQLDHVYDLLGMRVGFVMPIFSSGNLAFSQELDRNEYIHGFVEIHPNHQNHLIPVQESKKYDVGDLAVYGFLTQNQKVITGNKRVVSEFLKRNHSEYRERKFLYREIMEFIENFDQLSNIEKEIDVEFGWLDRTTGKSAVFLEASEIQRTNPNYTNLYKDLGVQIDDEAPEELRNSLRRLEASPDLSLEITKLNSYFVANMPYAPAQLFAGFSKEHAEFSEYLSMLSFRNPRIGRMESLGKVNANIIGGNLVEGSRLLFLLALFFLTEKRKRNWGAIKLGNQQTLGFVFHRTNSDLKKLVELFENMKPSERDESGDEHRGAQNLLSAQIANEINIYGQDWPAEMSRKWIIEMIKSLAKVNNATVYYVRGDAMQDIIEEVLRGEGMAHEIPVFCRMSATRERIEVSDEEIFFKYDDYGVIREGVGPNKSVLESGVGTFDTAQLPSIIRLIGNKINEYVILIIRHGVFVPVGIGYSLHMTPYLFIDCKDDNVEEELPLWKLIRKKAIELYLVRNKGAISKFQQAGIYFDPDVIAIAEEIQMRNDIDRGKNIVANLDDSG